MSISIFLLLAALLVLGLAGAVTRAAYRQRARFQRDSIPAEAEVTNLNTSRIRGVIFNSNGYSVGYAYFTAAPGSEEKVRQAGYSRISEYAAKRLTVGDTIRIIYLPSQPDISKPALEYLDEQAERTNALSCLYYASGAVAVLVIAGIAMLGQGNARQAVVDQATSQELAVLSSVRAVLDAKIPTWSQASNLAPVRISAADAGFGGDSDVREVYYGHCRTAGEMRFYLFVMRFIYTGKSTDAAWLGQGFGYTPGTPKTADCRPEDWSVVGDRVVEGDWHAVTVTYPAQIPFYKLTATAEAARSQK